MLFSSYGFAVLATAFLNIPTVAAVAPTDEYTDADPAQSGYLPNHNMDPAVVDARNLGIVEDTFQCARAGKNFVIAALSITPARSASHVNAFMSPLVQRAMMTLRQRIPQL
jgi:hypothetical protein